MTVTGLDVVELSSDFEASSSHIELRPWQWHFLHAIDGRVEVRNVAAACGVELPAAIAFVEEVHASGLLRVVSVSLADYRATNGIAAAAPVAVAVETMSEPAVTSDDHFSTTDVFSAYDRPVPAWMMEPQPPVEYEHEPILEHHDEYVEHVEHVEHVELAEHDAHAEHDAVAAMQPEPEGAEEEPYVSTGHAEFADLLSESPAHEEAAPEEPLPDPASLAFMHEEATASQAVADLVARHHEQSYAEHEYFTSSTAHVDEEPAAEPVAEYAPERAAEDAPDYSAEHEHTPEYVAELKPEFVAEHTPDADTERVPEYVAEYKPDHTENYVAEPAMHEAELEPEAEVAHSNGRSTAWESLSLVAHVDDDSAPVESDSFRDPSMPDGVSIWLSHGSSHAGVYEPESEKGSVSFSLSPEEGPDTHPITESASTPHDHAEPVAQAHAEVPAYEAASHDVADAYNAAKEPTNGHIDNLPAAEQSTGTTTADIVGSLISRALTFRIK